jgi:hypothetical protein
MKTICATARVGPDRTLTVQVPDDVPAGEHRIVVFIDDATSAGAADLPLPVHEAGLVSPNPSLRREDIYGDDGR